MADGLSEGTVGAPTILVVDDEPGVLAYETGLLEGEGYKVVTAACGRDALNTAAALSPSLILLDVVLPDIDGFTVCEHLREFTRVPIIEVSGKEMDPADKVYALDHGADDYITKPFSSVELLARVKARIRRTG